MRLIDERTPDGSRHFAVIDQNAGLRAMRNRVLQLKNAKVVNFIDEGIAKPWFDFTFRGHRFLIHCENGEYLLYVQDPQCPDLILFEVGQHLDSSGTQR